MDVQNLFVDVANQETAGQSLVTDAGIKEDQDFYLALLKISDFELERFFQKVIQCSPRKRTAAIKT